MSVSATSAATAVVTAGSGSVGAPPPALATWQFEIYDRSNNQLADITTIATSKRVSRRLSRPGSASFQVPSDDALTATLHSDGYPILSVGRRCLKVRHRASPSDPWVIYFNGIIWTLEDAGGEDQADTVATAYDPMQWFKFRYVQDANVDNTTGDLSTPSFVYTGGEISGPDLVKQMVDNTQTIEGNFGLDTTTGTFDIAVPPALDLSASLIDFPITMADFLAVLTNTGVCDVTIAPVDDADGFAAGIMGVLSAQTQAGAGTTIVHFDYGLGDYSIREIRRGEDLDNLSNKIWYYLGETRNVEDEITGEIIVRRWDDNITQDDGALPDPPQTDIEADMAYSQSVFGVAMSISIYDTHGDEDDPATKPLYHKLWQTENLLRNYPREMLFITPVNDSPFDVNALGLGDIITVNASSVLRGGLAAQQRIYGFDVEISDENVQSITQIVTSANEV